MNIFFYDRHLNQALKHKIEGDCYIAVLCDRIFRTVTVRRSPSAVIQKLGQGLGPTTKLRFISKASHFERANANTM